MIVHWVAIFVFIIVPTVILNQWVAITLYKRRLKQKETKFIQWVQVNYPDSRITYVAIDSSHQGALDKLRNQVDKGLVDEHR